MDELLVRLERQIRALIDERNQLSLGQSTLSREREILLVKQQKAITQIQTLVSRLKSIDNSSENPL